MADIRPRRAFYAVGRGRWGDWWTLLHPPYTLWLLSYVVIGATLAPHVDATRLIASLLAFFAAVGVAAHALDELHDRPLRTNVSDRALVVATVLGLAVAVALGVVGLARVGMVLLPFIVVGPILVLAYDLELFGGRLHTDLAFVLAWGAFPVLTGYVAQAGRLDVAALVGAAAATGFSAAQRALSTPARRLRRRVADAEARVVNDDGRVETLGRDALLAPLEHALHALSWAMVALAAALATARLT
jgi:hypothetical protein